MKKNLKEEIFCMFHFGVAENDQVVAVEDLIDIDNILAISPGLLLAHCTYI